MEKVVTLLQIASVFFNYEATGGDIYGTYGLQDLPPECYTQLYTDADIERHVYADYSPKIRPIINASQPIFVSFTIIFQRIVDMFEKERMILVEAYLIVEWKNELINWQDVFPINCSKKLIAPSHKMWTPDISVVNAPTDKYSLLLIRGHKVEVTYDGVCDFYPSGIFNATCSMNLRYFPFDEQVCMLRFAGWSYSSDLQQLSVTDTPIDFDHFEQHEQWDLYQYEAVNLPTFNPTSQKNYDEVQIILYLKRKPNFYLINVFIPPVIVSLAEVVIFSLPIQDGHRIFISFTVLLAFGVFQTMIVEEIPRGGGEALPLLSIYLDLMMSYLALVLVGQSVIFYVLKKAKQESPKWLLKIIIFLAQLLQIDCRNVVEKTMSPKNNHVPLFFDWERDGDDEDKNKTKDNIKPSSSSSEQEWLLIARVSERTLCCGYLTALFITPLVVYLILPKTP